MEHIGHAIVVYESTIALLIYECWVLSNWLYT